MGILVLNIGWLETKEVMDHCSKAEIGLLLRASGTWEIVWVLTRVPAFPADLNAEPTNLEAKGCVVAARDREETLGARDIVYIDLGLKHNIGPGDMFFISRPIAVPRDSGPCEPRDGWGTGGLASGRGDLLRLHLGEQRGSGAGRSGLSR